MLNVNAKGKKITKTNKPEKKKASYRAGQLQKTVATAKRGKKCASESRLVLTLRKFFFKPIFKGVNAKPERMRISFDAQVETAL